MPTYLTCGETTLQDRAGTNPTGIARRECQHCERTYTPVPKRHCFPLELRRQALKLYVDGTSLRRIARHLEVNPQTISSCVDAAAANLSAPLLVSVEDDDADPRMPFNVCDFITDLI